MQIVPREEAKRIEFTAISILDGFEVHRSDFKLLLLICLSVLWTRSIVSCTPVQSVNRADFHINEVHCRSSPIDEDKWRVSLELIKFSRVVSLTTYVHLFASKEIKQADSSMKRTLWLTNNTSRQHQERAFVTEQLSYFPSCKFLLAMKCTSETTPEQRSCQLDIVDWKTSSISFVYTSLPMRVRHRLFTRLLSSSLLPLSVHKNSSYLLARRFIVVYVRCVFLFCRSVFARVKLVSPLSLSLSLFISALHIHSIFSRLEKETAVN